MKNILSVLIMGLALVSVNVNAEVAEKGEKSISVFFTNSDTAGTTSTTAQVGFDIAVTNGLTVGATVAISKAGSTDSQTVGAGVRKYFATTKPISPYVGGGLSLVSSTGANLSGIKVEGGIKQPISETAAIDYNYSIASLSASGSSTTTETNTLLIGISISF